MNDAGELVGQFWTTSLDEIVRTSLPGGSEVGLSVKLVPSVPPEGSVLLQAGIWLESTAEDHRLRERKWDAYRRLVPQP